MGKGNRARSLNGLKLRPFPEFRQPPGNRVTSLNGLKLRAICTRICQEWGPTVALTSIKAVEMRESLSPFKDVALFPGVAGALEMGEAPARLRMSLGFFYKLVRTSERTGTSQITKVSTVSRWLDLGELEARRLGKPNDILQPAGTSPTSKTLAHPRNRATPLNRLGRPLISNKQRRSLRPHGWARSWKLLKMRESLSRFKDVAPFGFSYNCGQSLRGKLNMCGTASEGRAG